MKHYGYLANVSYIGMVFGPLCYLLMLVINHRFDIFKHTFILPGYFQAFIGLVYTIAFIKGFKQNYQTRQFEDYEDDAFRNYQSPGRVRESVYQSPRRARENVY